MATKITSVDFQNAIVNKDLMTVTEVFDDDIQVWDLNKILEDIHGLQGVSILISHETSDCSEVMGYKCDE